MLVLCRKPDEQIQIGPNITVTIIRVKGRSVVIGIEAPGNMKVLRGEFATEATRRALDGAASDSPDCPGPGGSGSSQLAQNSPGLPEPAKDEPGTEEEEDRLSEGGRPAPRVFACRGSRRRWAPGNWS